MSDNDKAKQMILLSQKVKELIIAENTDMLNKIFNDFNILYNPLDSTGISPLHFAVQTSRLNSASLLLSLAHDKPMLLSLRDAFGRSPLHVAAAKGNVSMTKLLIENGADTNAESESGETPLMKAIAFFQPKTIYLLLLYGGDPYKRNKLTGLDCFEQGRGTRDGDIVHLLESYRKVYWVVNMIRRGIGKIGPRSVERIIMFLIPRYSLSMFPFPSFYDNCFNNDIPSLRLINVKQQEKILPKAPRKISTDSIQSAQTRVSSNFGDKKKKVKFKETVEVVYVESWKKLNSTMTFTNTICKENNNKSTLDCSCNIY